MKEEKNKIYKVYENRPSIYLVEARSEEEAEKIIQERVKQVKENNKSNNSSELDEQIPDYISMILAKIISESIIKFRDLKRFFELNTNKLMNYINLS